MDNIQATLNLIEAKKILDTLGIHFWLTDGTLLGYYRENDFIKHDVDIDIALFAKDYTEKIVESFVIQGFKIEKRGTQAEGLKLAGYKNGVSIDLFFAYEEKDYIWYACWMENYELIENSKVLKYEILKFAYPKTKFKKIIFKEHEFNIPDDVEKYLSWVYGKYWQIPDQDWLSGSSKNLINAPWLQLPETGLKHNFNMICHLYTQVLLSLIQQYRRNPLEPDILSALQKARKQNADFWMSIPPEEIKTTYSGFMKVCHQILRESGIQNEITAQSELELDIISKMLNQAQERNLERNQYLLAALLYIRPDELQLQKDTNTVRITLARPNV